MSEIFTQSHFTNFTDLFVILFYFYHVSYINVYLDGKFTHMAVHVSTSCIHTKTVCYSSCKLLVTPVQWIFSASDWAPDRKNGKELCVRARVVIAWVVGIGSKNKHISITDYQHEGSCIYPLLWSWECLQFNISGYRHKLANHVRVYPHMIS